LPAVSGLKEIGLRATDEKFSRNTKDFASAGEWTSMTREQNPTGHILVAEDSRLQAALLEETLSGAGYTVSLARNGKEALRLFNDRPPDLVLTDIEMPEMTGYEFCRAVKDLAPEIPVVLLTQLREVQDVLKGLSAGANSYLTKPCEGDFLLQKVRELLEARRNPSSNGSITLAGETYQVTAPRDQILSLLLSTFENAVEQNRLLVQRNQQLQELNEKKNELLGMAAHDLRNPLNAILGYSNFFLDQFEDTLSEKQVRFISTIARSSNRMLDLVNDLLDVSALESGNVTLRLEVVDLKNVISQSLDVLNPLAKEKGIQIEFESDDIPSMRADPGKIEQIFTNLVSNALKFSHSETTVRVNLENQDDGVLLKVADQGQGIPSGEQLKLFRPFSRTSVTTTGGETSTGLGLAIVKKMVEGHGGQIWVDSEAGKGSTFSVFLPLSPPD
jgi:signal transduction histidine kinase